MDIIEAVRWSADRRAVRIIDQRLLPGALVERELRTLSDVCDAIATLAVRGAPAIGVAGALGLVASLVPHADDPRPAFDASLARHAAAIRRTRPTAVNLAWAVDRVLARAAAESSQAASGAVVDAMRAEATAIYEEDRLMCERIGEHGVDLVPDGARILTHCNAGALATAGIGTALAPVYLAARAGRNVEVYADETRPLFQGSRLTAWELQRAGIRVTVLADSMAATLLRSGAVDACIVGADRIAANGDVANKVGTYSLALAARHHGVPFYVAAPTSTIDPATARGEEIVIEQRDGAEVVNGIGGATAPDGVAVYNPAFDVTPAALVSAIITDRGLVRPPYDFSVLSWAPGAAASGGAGGREERQAHVRGRAAPPRPDVAAARGDDRHRSSAASREPSAPAAHEARELRREIAP